MAADDTVPPDEGDELDSLLEALARTPGEEGGRDPGRDSSPKAPLAAGQVVGERFQIEARIGAGGMAEVYRARDLSTGAAAAVKVLFEASSNLSLRFEREARTLAVLHHPGIVPYLGHGTMPDGRCFLAMAWLEGETLGRRLESGPLAVSECLALAERVAEALAVAHARGIVHRDVKPSNLFLARGDVRAVTLLDFGIARDERSARALTRTGLILGTPAYMAPEQARGDAEIDSRADVFSLGCVLFECLTGRAAFVGDHPLAVFAKIVMSDASRVRDLRPEVPAALDDLVTRMLCKDPSGRPASMEALAAELATLRESELGAGSFHVPIALTRGEQRVVCVVLAAVPAGVELPPERMEKLRHVVEPAGAHLESLADGTVFAVLAGAGLAKDQAVRAARCSLAMRALLPDHPMTLSTGAGELRSHSLIGEVIDRGARLLLGSSAPGAPLPIRLDEVTAGLLDARFEVSGDEHGLALVGERAMLELPRTLLGRPTPFVGRGPDLGLLRAIHAECIGEPVARAVLVTAPAGFGKSRLLHELLAGMRQGGTPAEILVGRGDPSRAGSPFAMAAHALQQTAGILAGEPLVVRQRKLRARVLRHLAGEDGERAVAALSEMIGAPLAEVEQAPRDRMLRGDQMRFAWEDWLRAECSAQPVVLVLEDMHWGDRPTANLIDAALRNLADLPLLVIALARPEVHDVFPSLWSSRGVRELRLGELTRRASERLVREVLGDDTAAAVVERVAAQAAGNAFYLEELIRMAAEKGTELPGTVIAMVQSRLEELQAPARRLLRAASIFGQVFWRGGVATLLGMSGPTPELEGWLSLLVDRELIAPSGDRRFPNEATYAFRHALVREGAYCMLTDADRTLGHGLAAMWLERMGETDSLSLAEHFERGGEGAYARRWYEDAAEEALAGNDLEAALERAERAAACGATGPELGALRLLQAEAYGWRGQQEDALAHAEGAMKLLPRTDPRWYAAAGILTDASGKLGHHERLTALGGELCADGEALAESEPTALCGAWVVASVRAAAQLYFAGRAELADRLIAATERWREAFADRDPAVAAWIDHARSVRALVQRDLGAYVRLKEAVATAFARAGDRRNACAQRVRVGYGYLEVGAFAEAERALREVLPTAAQMGLSPVIALADHNLGLALARQGKLEEARRVEAAAVDAFRAHGDRRLESAARKYLAMIDILAGDLVAAEEEVRAAVAVAPAQTPGRAYALALLAEVLLARGSREEALAPAQEAMAILDAIRSMDEGEALVRLMYAEALTAAGRREEARAAIAVAWKRLDGHARRISDDGLRASFLERIPENARTAALAKELAVEGP